jgi:hypothetical protein
MEKVMEQQSVAPNSSVQTPFCANLRSKKYFMLNVIPTKVEDFMDASGCCWCYHTMQVRGPDEGFVEPESCVPGRACYQTAFGQFKQSRGA